MAIALRLGACRREPTAAIRAPLLDDASAELDTARRRALAGVAGSAEQVLVTAAWPIWGEGRAQNSMRDDDSGRVSMVEQ